MNFSRPSQLPTPPETDTDFLAGFSGHHPADLMNASAVHGTDPDFIPHPFAGVPIRRVSTLAYHNSPLHNPRERPNSRQSRWLIIVIPPPSLVQDHGPLGNTLTSGPSHRLSQGVVMPLQPTMYSQLNAIAREFNFPSSVGLCLYLHFTEHGITMAPRISDEIWPALWGHLFEARSPGLASQMPICGRVEFDIDRRKARWLDSWLNSDRRHAADVPVSVPPSLSHYREDSKTSFDERGDERPEVFSGLPTVSRSRHIPKKLSLVDKLETLSLTSSAGNAITGNGVVHALSTSLATVLQEDEPKTAKIALDKRVESWIVSSSVAPTPMATTGQTSFETMHVPNDIQLSDIDILAETDVADDIDLNDFAWSTSSAGPPDYESLVTPVSMSHVPSVHLDRRLEGSVLLTPSTATSWGPKTIDDFAISTPFLLPSPDIGQRVIENCPPTPSTATSWGPEELLCSPASVKFRLPSPDIGRRIIEDCPPTPSTATSWGPEELLYSPASVMFRLPSPDLGLRTLEDCPPTPFTSLPEELFHPPFSMVSCHPTPNLGIRMPCIWPYTLSILSTGNSPLTKKDVIGTSGIVELYPSSHVFPYLSVLSRGTWVFAWPFFTTESASKPLPLQFPNLGPVVETREETLIGASQCPFTGHVTDVQPLLEATHVYLKSSYPNLVIYPPVYPYLSIYLPHHVGPNMKEVQPSSIHKYSITPHLGTQYPYFDLYPAGYPSDLMCIYPPAVWPNSASSLQVRLPPSYPAIELYPPQYPFVIPYPHKTVPSFTEVDQTVKSRQVRSVNLTPDAPLYPVFAIYPAVAGPSKVTNMGLHLQVYPRLTLYPAVYPELCLYTSIFAEETGSIEKTDLTSQYPCLRLYPAVYPWFEIYPGHVSAGENDATTSHYSVSLQPVYPHFDIYPAVYPYFDIYGTGSPKKEDQWVPLSTLLPAQYPALSLYPPIYPHIEIFPPTQTHGNLTEPQHPTPVSERMSASDHAHFLRRVRKTHRELHEEVFGADTPMNGSVERTTDEPLGGIQTRNRTRSKSINAHAAVLQAASSPSSSPPPVPSLPMSHRLSLRIPSHNAEGRHSGPSTHPSEAHSRSIDWRTSSLVTSNTHSSLMRNVDSIDRSNSLRTGSSSPRKDHGHSRQNRPRDSLVLEKARHFDHLHALARDDHASTVVNELANLPVPPVPQLPFEIPQPQTLNHTKSPFA